MGDGRVHKGPHTLQYHADVYFHLQRAIDDAYFFGQHTPQMTVPGAKPDYKGAIGNELSSTLRRICELMNTPGNPWRLAVTSPKGQ